MVPDLELSKPRKEKGMRKQKLDIERSKESRGRRRRPTLYVLPPKIIAGKLISPMSPSYSVRNRSLPLDSL